MSTALPDREVVDAIGLVPLYDDEYAVSLPPGQHRGASDMPDPIRVAQTLGEGIVGRVSAGIGLIRATAGLGFRLVGLGRMPLAIAVGPLGRAAIQQKAEPERPPVVVRSLGEDIDPATDDLDVAYPHATDRLVVFVPAPGEDESSWRRSSERVGGTYGSRLAALLDWTPVFLRADDTVPVNQSSVALSALLQQVVEAWPVDVRRVVLVGHAGGGLVARGACGIRAFGERPWTDLVTDVVLLGTPHLVARPQRMTRKLARDLDEKLAGIISEDDAVVDVAPLDGVRYVLVTDTVTVNSHTAGRVLGDMLWWRQRATFRHRRARDLFPTAERHEVSTADHPMVNHPDVHGALLAWLT